MQRATLIVCILVSLKSMALTTISDVPVDGKTAISAQKYLTFNPVLGAETQLDPQEQPLPGLPAKSHLKEGPFDSYQLSECQKFSNPFFVVGLDDVSLAWLKEHSSHLKSAHALGIVTNIENKKDLEALDAISPIKLIPSNVDGLAEVVKAPAYPFFTNGCEVWQ